MSDVSQHMTKRQRAFGLIQAALAPELRQVDMSQAEADAWADDLAGEVIEALEGAELIDLD